MVLRGSRGLRERPASPRLDAGALLLLSWDQEPALPRDRAACSLVPRGVLDSRAEGDVPSEHLNFFEPWPDLAADHENQLTRAFLVILRLCPTAHQSWLRLVNPELDLSRLPAATFDTQTAQLTRAHLLADDHNFESAVRGISVLQAADVQPVSGPVTESERRAIFDGIVSYGNKLVLVVEVKRTAPPSDSQAREVPLRGRLVQMDEIARPVDWRALLEA
jgi:hypothetical protein